MLHCLGKPHMSYRAIHVGGTNGKGSVCAMAAAVMETAGNRVGLYTSPHLIDFSERIRILGRPAEPQLLEAAARRLRPLAQEAGATFFETTTALAFLCFAEAGVDYAIAEVGLGGRLDSTNVLLPETTVITQVAWDHADYLGTSLPAIAREKAGICKPGVPLVIGRLDAEPRATVLEAADAAGSPVLELGRHARIDGISTNPAGTKLSYHGRCGVPLELAFPLVGEHQADNAALAALACESLPEPMRPRDADIVDGLGRVRWPGRCQIERRSGRTWVLDAAHNPAAIETLQRTVEQLGLEGPVVSVVAILGDKPWRRMLGPVLEMSDRSIFTVAPSSPAERRWDAGAVAATVGGAAVEVVEPLGAALERAVGLGETIIVTGSHHTVGDAMKELGVEVTLPYSRPLE